MADTSNLSNFLKDVADAIRNKKGTTDEIPASTFDTEIENISTLKGQEVNITPSTSEQIITPDANYNGITKATVSAVDSSIDENIVPENIKKTVSILGVTGALELEGYNNQDIDVTENGVYTANTDEGYTGLGTVTVNIDKVLSSADYQTCLELADDIKGNPAPTEGSIYGVKRLTTTTSTTWERTNEGMGLVANATHDGTEVQNDFDNIYPWSDIISYDFDSGTQLATAYYGDNEFTFAPESTTVNVFTKIPRFWARRYIDDDNYEHIEIADYAADGFTEISERSVARYSYQNSTTVPRSISGLKPLASTATSDYRTGTTYLGTNACLLDIETVSVIQILYLVEYADYNSQNTLGYGRVSASATITSGGCDSLGMKSGCLVNDQAHSMIYRGIENIFGNIYQYVDGCICNTASVHISYDKNNYTDSDTTNYELLGYNKITSSGWIKTMGYDSNNPFIMLPTAVGGSNSTYIPDYHWSSGSNHVLRLGGYYTDSADVLHNGLFYMDCAGPGSYTAARYGARFILKD